MQLLGVICVRKVNTLHFLVMGVHDVELVVEIGQGDGSRNVMFVRHENGNLLGVVVGETNLKLEFCIAVYSKVTTIAGDSEEK